MSYDLLSLDRESIELGIECYSKDQLIIRFRCPRCNDMVEELISPLELASEVEIECMSPRCKAPDERPGYQLSLSLVGRVMYLGLNDRPLHDVPAGDDVPF